MQFIAYCDTFLNPHLAFLITKIVKINIKK